MGWKPPAVARLTPDRKKNGYRVQYDRPLRSRLLAINMVGNGNLGHSENIQMVLFFKLVKFTFSECEAKWKVQPLIPTERIRISQGRSEGSFIKTTGSISMTWFPGYTVENKSKA